MLSSKNGHKRNKCMHNHIVQFNGAFLLFKKGNPLAFKGANIIQPATLYKDINDVVQ